jgi:hypothetical protein
MWHSGYGGGGGDLTSGQRGLVNVESKITGKSEVGLPHRVVGETPTIHHTYYVVL